MTGLHGHEGLARSVAAVVAPSRDVAEAMAHLVAACRAAYPAAEVAVLVKDAAPGLELLSSTSHQLSELELLQVQGERGPCVEAISTGRLVRATGRGDMEQRWQQVGTAIADAGYAAVHAYPMCWHGETIGGLNIFLRQALEPEPSLGQLFADLATVAVLQPGHVAPDVVDAAQHRHR